MKSAIAVAGFSAATISLQGCGDSATTTSGPTPCTYEPELKWECPTTLPVTTFQDMGDGDTKNVTLENSVLTISGEGWNTSLVLDQSTCMGSVNFTVPGKPEHPDGNLTVALMSSYASESSCSSPSNFVMSFSNPGDLGYVPVNQWVESGSGSQSGTNYTCFSVDPPARHAFFDDMHDGDTKVVGYDCSGTGPTCALTITPKETGNWTVQATIDKSTCSGMVDFNVPGKPDPPPNPIQATFRISRWYSQHVMVDIDTQPVEYFIEWSDAGTQVNQWVEVGNPGVLPSTPAPLPTTGSGTTAPGTTAPATTAPVNGSTSASASTTAPVSGSTSASASTTAASSVMTSVTGPVVISTTSAPGVIVA